MTTLSGVPKDASSARFAIEERSRAIAQATIEAEALVGQLKGNKAFIGQATRDYAGRFVYELIQNAYDAHPPGARGAAHILLDAGVGDHGVLYVANAGKPFDYEDFRAISEIAQTSKQPGEGIGNKGVGFKSVLQVSEWPEIYSSSSLPRLDLYDGFCFGFARPDDMFRLVNGDEAAARLLLDRVSPYALPVVADAQDANVLAFAAAGMATVCRLPMRSATAFALAASQIHEIAASVAPVLLFLDRIGELTLEIRGAGGLNVVLGREVRVLDSPTDIGLEEVDLGDAGSYLVVERSVAHDAFMAAIRSSIEVQLIDPAWVSWKQAVRVSVAVRLDADLTDGRLYCYLPMGTQAVSPTAAHVNAPFVVRLARDGLIEPAPLNDLLFANIADACAAAALFLQTHDHSRSVVPDLVTWSTRLPTLREAFVRAGVNVADATIIPVLGEPHWSTITAAYHWDDGAATVLTASRIAAAAGTPILDASIGSTRVGRILKLHLDVMRRSMNPSVEETAEWVEAVAGSLRDRALRTPETFEPGPWLAFYDELSVRFSDGGTALAGRNILIDDDLALRPCWGNEPDERQAAPAIFFQARGDEADEEADAAADVSIPATLRRYLAYMHSGLEWRLANPQGRLENRPGRRFLESQSLVRPFRRQSLFERIRDLLEKSNSKRIRSDALRLVFNLAEAGSYTQRPALSNLNLRVPTEGGWLPAARARFSEAWPETDGGHLRQLITGPAGQVPELAALTERMLLPPVDWGFRLDPERWVPFLRRIGVRDGLWPIALRASVGDYTGGSWTAPAVAKWAGLRAEDAASWIPVVERADRSGWHRDTPYRSDAVIRLPGQSDFDTLDPLSRERFGRLIASGLGSWPASVESFVIQRPRHLSAPDEHVWPSPSWAFLEAAAWVAVTRPGESGAIDLARPSDVWHYQDDGEPHPLFAPLLGGDLRHRVDADPKLLARLQRLGMRLWSDAAQSARRVQLLAHLFERGIADSQLAAFRKAYERSWAQIIAGGHALPWQTDADIRVIVSRRGQLGVFPSGGDADEQLYILAQPDRLAETLLGALDVPVLQVGSDDGRAAAELLLPLLADSLRVIASGDFRIFVDGVALVADPDHPFIVGPGREWLVDLLALTLELKATQFNRQTEQTVRSAVERLRKVRLKTGHDLHIELDGQSIVLPDFMRRVLAVPSGEDPIVAYIDPQSSIGWWALERIAQPLADLVGQTLSGAELRLAIAALARRADSDELMTPTDDDYSHALGESVARISEVRRGLRAVVDDLVHLLRPVAFHLAEVDLLQLMAAAGDNIDTDNAIEALLEPWFANRADGVTAGLLVAKAREVGTLADLRDALGLDYRSFNGTLAALGRPYAPFRNAEGQELAFAAHLAGRRTSVADALRAAYIASFDAGDDLSDYVASMAEFTRAMNRRSRAAEGSTPGLEPLQSWVAEYDLPPDRVMDNQIDDWVRSIGADPSEGSALEPLDGVRTANRRAVAMLVDRARPIIGAWCGRFSEVDPPEWAAVDPPVDLVDRFAAAGRLDFRDLGEGDVIETLVRWSEWPEGMPRTLEINALGLTPEDLAEQRSAAERARWLREQERRSVTLDDRRVSLEPAQIEDLIASVRSGITPEFLATRVRTAVLKPLGPGRGAPGHRGGGRTPYRGGRLSDAKAETIGFIGELVAYEWLVAQFSIGPEGWVSANRRFLFPDDAGDDGLGYDFLVARRRGRPRLFEVKSVSNPDAEVFELSEAEIRTAQEHAGKGDYQILFISDVLNSTTRTVHILPNPLDPGSHGRYRVVGTGIRYAFQLGESQDRPLPSVRRPK
jgi:hypothetical protein